MRSIVTYDRCGLQLPLSLCESTVRVAIAIATRSLHIDHVSCNCSCHCVSARQMCAINLAPCKVACAADSGTAGATNLRTCKTSSKWLLSTCLDTMQAPSLQAGRYTFSRCFPPCLRNPVRYAPLFPVVYLHACVPNKACIKFGSSLFPIPSQELLRHFHVVARASHGLSHVWS